MKIIPKLSSHSRKDGKRAVYISLSGSRQRVLIPTGHHVVVKDWDKERALFKNDYEGNKKLMDIAGSLQELHRKTNLPPKRLADRYFQDNKPPEDFYKLFDDYIEKKGFVGSTLDSMVTVKEKLMQKYPVLFAFDITPNLLDEYVWYLTNNLGNVKSTVRLNISKIKQVALFWDHNSPIARYSVPTGKAEPKYLTVEELTALK